MAQSRKRPPLAAGLLGSAVLHGAAAAMVAAALAWRAMPAAPATELSLQVVWLPPAEVAPDSVMPARAMPEDVMGSAPLGPAAAEGFEPEDALATQVGALDLPATPPSVASLPPLPIPTMEMTELPADPTALFAAQAPRQMASLAVPQPVPSTDATLPLPPPLPPPPRPRAAAPAPAQPAALPAPAAPAAAAGIAPPTASAAIPVVSGAPRFRRPPAPPAYPDRMREAGIEGTALLRLRIARDGTTLEIRLLRSAGHRLLDAAAEAAARGWDIAPPLRDGAPIEAWVEVPVRFRLDE